MNLDEITKAIESLPAAEQEGFLAMLADYESSVKRERAQKDFMSYTNEMWPGFVNGRHHKVMAKKFQDIAEGRLKRLIINMPPRHTKSEFASYLLPAWFLGKYPNKKIIQCSNTAELATGFGRKVRNLVGSEQYAKVFPNVSLRQDSKAAGRWSTNHNGEYFAIGVGGTVTGKGADLLIIDDPHSEQEAKLAASSPEIFDSVYEWYTSGPRQRLQPGGSIVIVMCMTGDTPVLMANGTEKPLRDVRAGDVVATFDNGKLLNSKVNNWQSSGVDSIYKIQTQSGKILRANERHPFLVMNEGVLEWTRLNQLQRGDLLVSLKDAKDSLGQQQSRANAGLADQKNPTIEKTQTHHINQLAIMESGKVLPVAWTVVKRKLLVVACALHIMAKSTLQKSLQKKRENTDLNIGTESLLSSTRQWLKSAITFVIYANSPLQAKTHAHIGVGSYVSTTATIQGRSEVCSATTATLPLAMARRQTYLSELHRISDFTVDEIISITPDGEEEVFDVEIDRTENFIANGVVSHNTRWSKKDLTGRILQSSMERDGETWELIEFPAILPSGNPLWPEFWSYEELDALRDELPPAKWNAQYQQSPTSEEGALIKRDWWKVWEKEEPPPCDYILQSWDTAFSKSERADYSACTTWGVFYPNENPEDPNIILLDAFKKRMEFPELKEVAMKYYREWEPDSFIVEAKASGAPLIYELRAMGIPVQEFTPTRGNDKIVRVNAISDLFASGKVWAPPKRWAEEVIEELAAFPNSDHDDFVDSTSQALLRFRKGGFIRLQTDEIDEPRSFRRKGAYY
jgi:predicted phage terminase large subunit-like protein